MVRGGALAVATVSVSDINGLIGLGRDAIDAMTMFSKALLPTMATVTAVSGAPAGAAARQLATVLFSDVLLTLIDRLLIPLVYLYVAAFTAYAAVGTRINRTGRRPQMDGVLYSLRCDDRICGTI